MMVMIQPEIKLYEVCQTAKGGPLDSLQPGDHRGNGDFELWYDYDVDIRQTVSMIIIIVIVMTMFQS